MEPSSTAVVPSISYTPLPANVTAWQSALNRTVLVIFYNNADIPNEFSVSLLRAIYGRIFMQVVIAAPEARPRLGVVQVLLDTAVMGCDINVLVQLYIVSPPAIHRPKFC